MESLLAGHAEVGSVDVLFVIFCDKAFFLSSLLKTCVHSHFLNFPEKMVTF